MCMRLDSSTIHLALLTQTWHYPKMQIYIWLVAERDIVSLTYLIGRLIAVLWGKVLRQDARLLVQGRGRSNLFFI